MNMRGMMKSSLLIAAMVATSAFAADVTVADSATRFVNAPARIQPHIVYTDQVGPSFVLPVVGSTPGAFNTFFKSDTVISNFREAPQRISITILRQNTPSGSDPVIYRDLPAYRQGGELAIVSEDFLASLGRSGLAAVLVQAVDGAGNLDPNGQLDGFTRIWTTPTSGGEGTMSQTLYAVPPDGLKGASFPAFSVGLRQDANFRTNVGIVNLSHQGRRWKVDFFGVAGSTTMNVDVPPFAMVQVAAPAGNFGQHLVTFTLDTTVGTDIANTRWAAYASSVDNRTGDGWVRQATY